MLISRIIAKAPLHQARCLSSVPSSFDEALVGLPSGAPGVVGPSPPTEVTHLPNGIRVASQDAGDHVASMGVFVEAGSRFEKENTAGAAHLLAHMAFKSTNKRSDLRLFRDMEDAGIVCSAAHGRDSIMYRIDTLRDHTMSGLEIISETVTDAKFPGWEVAAVKNASLSAELEQVETSAQTVLSEMVHSGAFGGEETPLGRSAFAARHNFGNLDRDILRSYVLDNYTPHRIVVAGVNVDHATLTRFAESAFADLPEGGATPKSAPLYTGGKTLVHGTGNMTHVAVAYEGYGRSTEDLYSQLVLQYILGGGSRITRASIGSGFQSRLFRNVVSDNIPASYAFSSTYNDAGIFGVYGACENGCQGELLGSLTNAIEGLATEPPNQDELNRAKNMLKASVANTLSSRGGNLEDMANQTMVQGQRKPINDIFALIDDISAASVKGTAGALLKSKPTIAVLGNVDGL